MRKILKNIAIINLVILMFSSLCFAKNDEGDKLITTSELSQLLASRNLPEKYIWIKLSDNTYNQLSISKKERVYSETAKNRNGVKAFIHSKKVLDRFSDIQDALSNLGKKHVYIRRQDPVYVMSLIPEGENESIDFRIVTVDKMFEKYNMENELRKKQNEYSTRVDYIERIVYLIELNVSSW